MTSTLIIPPRPDLLFDIQHILQQPEPCVSSIVQLIKRDVALYTVLLATVNSPLYRRQFLIESAEHAVATLGVERVGTLVQAVAMRTATDPEGHWQQFWEAATEVATLCYQLSQPLQCMQPDSAYTLGMMHDIGVPVMAASFSDHPQKLAQFLSCNAAQVRRLERECFTTDRFDVAGRLAKEWFMSDELVDALRYQAHAQAALMGKAKVSDTVLAANALLILAKDVSQEYHSYWNFESRDALNRLVRQAVEYLAIGQHEYLDIKDDLVEQLAMAEMSTTP